MKPMELSPEHQQNLENPAPPPQEMWPGGIATNGAPFNTIPDQPIYCKPTSATDGEPFQLMKLPYDLRRRIYEVIFPTNKTLYITMGTHTIRYPPPINFRIGKGHLNLIRCSKAIKDETYSVLYSTNKFAINPELPDMMFSRERPHTLRDGQLECYRNEQLRDLLAKQAVADKQAAGIVPTDGELYRASVPQVYDWYSYLCFFGIMSPTTCAKVRELQIFIGDTQCLYQQLTNIRFRTIRHFPRVVVTSIPLFHGLAQRRRINGQLCTVCPPAPLEDQVRQRRQLRELRWRIAHARAGGGGVTVWDNLGESSCGGFFLEEGLEGFVYEHLPDNARWFWWYKSYYIGWGPMRALPGKNGG
ncbi:MAG: hypothetical protein Q9218_004889 [Villophora microphyllina]